MAVLSITNLSKGVQLGLWKIEETVSTFLQQYPHLQNVVEMYHNDERKKQKLAVYALLYTMIGRSNFLINHDKNGKPLLSKYNLSISDTKGFVAVILSKQHNVAVDIEYFSHRVNRIVTRFVRKDEIALNTKSQLIHWSAKETVFKYYSSQKLHYEHMRLHPFDILENGCVLVDNLKGDTTLSVVYQINSEYVLTYAY